MRGGRCRWAAAGPVLLAPGTASQGSGDALLLPPSLPAQVRRCVLAMLGTAHAISPSNLLASGQAARELCLQVDDTCGRTSATSLAFLNSSPCVQVELV